MSIESSILVFRFFTIDSCPSVYAGTKNEEKVYLDELYSYRTLIEPKWFTFMFGFEFDFRNYLTGVDSVDYLRSSPRVY
jgi:hypothetical protein